MNTIENIQTARCRHVYTGYNKVDKFFRVWRPDSRKKLNRLCFDFWQGSIKSDEFLQEQKQICDDTNLFKKSAQKIFLQERFVQLRGLYPDASKTKLRKMARAALQTLLVAQSKRNQKRNGAQCAYVLN